MIRNLKALGLALFAVLALGAVAAPGASAALFNSEKSRSTVVTGEGSFTFGTKSSAFTVTCIGTYRGTQTGATAESITLHPTIHTCTNSLGAHPTIDTDGCDFIFYASTTTHQNTSGSNETDSPRDLECTAGSVLKVTDACPIVFPAQAGLHGVKYYNEGSGATRDIKITATVDNLHYTTPGSFACSLIGLPTNGNDGTVTGSTTVKGYEDIESAAPTPHKDSFEEGVQVGIWWE